MEKNDNNNIIDVCIEITQKYKQKLPYHLNIIEELHSNENSHSRILAKLFQYQNQGKFVIFESFIEFIVAHNRDKKFGEIKVNAPIISQEEERIDIWIRDDDYAIIFENKIYDADDKVKQIERYITNTLYQSYRKENIYVIYMPPFTREPSEQSWGFYKEDFADRFAIVSFNEDIIEWLKESVLPNITLKEVYLRSAIEQYIDYLEGYSGRRELTHKEWALSFLYDKLGIKKSSPLEEHYFNLMKFHRDLNKVRNECNEQKQEIAKTVIDSFNTITQNYFGNDWKCLYNESGYYQIYKQEWEDSQFIHFEWTNLTYDNLFDSKYLTFVIHAEKSIEIWETLSNNIKFSGSGEICKFPVCVQKRYYVSNKNSFAELSIDEKEAFLKKVYGEFEKYIEIVDKTLKGYKKS